MPKPDATELAKIIKTPIWDMLQKYAQEDCVRFHMPGHKGNSLGKPGHKGYSPNSFLEAFEAILPYDVTEIPGTDNLHEPKEAILEAEWLLAKAYGADKSFLLVNGSTCGMLASIGTAFSAGDKVLLDAACHRCVYHGLELVGAKGVVLEEMTPEGIAAAVVAEPLYKGVIVTRPDYYGVCKDIEGIAGVCEDLGLLLIADEAHGAHLAFGQATKESVAAKVVEGSETTTAVKGYPVSAVQYAHFTIQSAHKTLGAFNQSAYLHLHGKGAAYVGEVRRWLSVLQTSSPSYLILASGDCARAYMEEHGREGLQDLAEQIERAAREIEETTPFTVKRGEKLPKGFVKTPDRLVIDTKAGGISGYQAEAFLRTQHIQVECANEEEIVCLCTVFDQQKDFDRLAEALKALASAGTIGTTEMEGRKNVLARLRGLVGQTLKQDLVPYPPGVPLARRGEVLTSSVYENVARIYLAGGNVLGMDLREPKEDTQEKGWL